MIISHVIHFWPEGFFLVYIRVHLLVNCTLHSWLLVRYFVARVFGDFRSVERRTKEEDAKIDKHLMETKPTDKELLNLYLCLKILNWEERKEALKAWDHFCVEIIFALCDHTFYYIPLKRRLWNNIFRLADITVGKVFDHSFVPKILC